MKIALALLLFVVLATAAPLLHSENTNVIAGSYIVILNEDLTVNERDAHIQELKDTISASADSESEIGFTYEIGTFIGFSARLSPSLLKQELTHPDVKYVEADQVMRIIDEIPVNAPEATVTQTGATWGLDRVDQRNLPLNGLYTYDNTAAGSGVDVYVVDTGIRITHNDFGGRAVWGANYVGDGSNTDGNGHGTHCAGTVGGTTYGVAKQARLIAVKVLGADGSGTNAGVISGINYVASNSKSTGRPSVGSMSLGGGKSTTLNNAVAAAISAGTPFAVAAGNEAQNACNVSPASTPSAVTVGATTNTDARASYSNYGTCVDLFAPGSSITSDWYTSNTATNTISGTSMATPHVAGAMALYRSQPSKPTGAATSAWVVSNATPNKVTNPGTGSPNKLLYTIFTPTM